jgi:hypothetical protein
MNIYSSYNVSHISEHVTCIQLTLGNGNFAVLSKYVHNVTYGEVADTALPRDNANV